MKNCCSGSLGVYLVAKLLIIFFMTSIESLLLRSYVVCCGGGVVGLVACAAFHGLVLCTQSL